jgi:hypothetical protein
MDEMQNITRKIAKQLGLSLDPEKLAQATARAKWALERNPKRRKRTAPNGKSERNRRKW